MSVIDSIRKSVLKKNEDAIVDLTEPTLWLNSGNWTLNHILSGKFSRGFPAGRITQVYGLSGSGKSYLIARAIAEAQKEEYVTVVFDSEAALSQDYLESIGVDTSPSKLITIQVSTVEEAMSYTIDSLNSIKEEQAKSGKAAIKLLMIVDGIGMLQSDKVMNDAEAGKTVGDMGTKAKALTKMFTAIVNKIASTDAVYIFTNHGAMEVGAMYPQLLPKGGQSPEYVPSITLRVQKGKLKPANLEEFEHLYATSGTDLDVLGIIAKVDLYKSRFTRPFRKVQLMIPYDHGLPSFAGFFDYLYSNKILEQTGRGWYECSLYPDKKFTRKAFVRDGHADAILAKLLEAEENGTKFDFVMKKEFSELPDATVIEEEVESKSAKKTTKVKKGEDPSVSEETTKAPILEK